MENITTKLFSIDGDLIHVTLPEGKTQAELISMCEAELNLLIPTGVTFGRDMKINGRLSTGMALVIGHKLAHVCKSVSIFDPRENTYIKCIWH